MFEEILFMICFALFSVAISHVLLKYTPGFLNRIIRALAMVGIIIHELCHILMCLITNTRIKKIRLLAKNEDESQKGKFEYFGNITVKGGDRLTFLQAMLISLAPLIFSFWIFFFLLEQIFNPEINIVLFFLYLFIMVSIVLAAAPSFADLICIPKAFREDPYYSIYQVFLLLLSLLTFWIVVSLLQLTFFHEIIVYILIMIFYYSFKYSFKGINELIHKLNLRNSSTILNEINYKAHARRRFKPTKPRKLGIEEAHW